MVGEEKALVFFLERCFYTTGRHIRLKKLPLPHIQNGEHKSFEYP